MDLTVLAQNLKRLRKQLGVSQEKLAKKSGLSEQGIKKIERGGSATPRVSSLEAIADALGVGMGELFKPVRVLKAVRFRSQKRMKCRDQVLADTSRMLDDFNFLEKTLGQSPEFRLKSIVSKAKGKSPVAVAAECRKALSLKEDEPIHDICGLLEHAGIKLIPVKVSSPGFFGLSVGEADGGPAIAVNMHEKISVERMIFSAAHELGHLMLHPDAYDVNKVDESKEEEQEADRFAGHFLMPNEGFRKEWNEAAGLHFVDRVFKVKRIFRVSYKTVLSRLLEEGAVDKSIWMKFNMAYQQHFNRKLSFKEEPMGIDPAEPFGMQRFDFYEDRFKRLTREAVEKDKISLSRGAEMLRIGIEEMQDLLQNWEVIL